MISIQFLLTALVVVIAPGTGVIYTLALGLGQGRRAALWAALGCTFGIVPHLVAATLGLAAILHTSAVLFSVIKWAGVAYLLYLAWQVLKSGGALCADQHPEPQAVDLLSGASATLCVGQRCHGHAGNDTAWRCLYGDDICSLCFIWLLCSGSAQMVSGLGTGHALAQPVVRGDLYRPRGPPRIGARMTLSTRIPPAALLLTVAGLTPFLFGAIMTLELFGDGISPEVRRVVGDGRLMMLRYGVIILCFMSGVLWGFATKTDGVQAAMAYVLSVIPALWAFLFPGSSADEALINLMIGFAGVLLLDFAFRSWDLAPEWWMTLRVPVTLVVLACLAVGVWA